MATEDRTSLAYWFPLIENAGLPVPETRLVTAKGDLAHLLDGREPEHWVEFVAEMREAVEAIGVPCFLRTSHGSGKHDWSETCYLADPQKLEDHIFSLVEWSHLVDMFGLPHDMWAVRKLIPTEPLFRCELWGGFPVTREFRVFIRDDEIEHVQPYWPAEAVEEGQPDDPEWREKLAVASKIEYSNDSDDLLTVVALAGQASKAVGGGYWSIDFLQDREGEWWLTDMADGDQSFKYEVAVKHGVANE